MPANTVRRLAWGIAALSLIWALVLALDLVPPLRGDYGWRWPYTFPPEHPERLVWLALALGLYCVEAWWLVGRQSATAVIAWAIAGSVGLTLAVLYVSTSEPIYELYTRTVTPLTTGWHYAAADIDSLGGGWAVLRDWPNFIQHYASIASHVSVSPPGLPLIYYGADRLLERLPDLARVLSQPLRADQCDNFRLMGYSNGQLASAWLGILMPVWAGLTVLPLYWLGRRLYNKTAALLAVLWWPLIPSLLMFTPQPSTAYPLPTLIAVGLLLAGFTRRQPGWIVVSGVVTSVLTFTNFSMLPLIFMAGVLTLLVFWAKRQEWRLAWWWPFVTGLWFGVGLASIWAIYYLVSGLTFLDMFRAIMTMHFTLDRPYWPWLYLHLNDYGMFNGWPLILMAGVDIWLVVRALRDKSARTPGAMLALAALATLLATDLSGIGRGESGRIWLFLSPFLLLVAAEVMTLDQSQRSGWIITAAQAIMVLVLVGFVHVIDSGLNKPPTSPPEIAGSPGSPVLQSGAVFDGALHLNDFAGEIETLPDKQGKNRPTLVLWLEWQSTGQVDRPYYLSFIPVAPDGHSFPKAILLQPLDGKYPVTCWLPSKGVIQDRVELPLGDTDVKGDWWVSLSLIEGSTGRKASLVLPDGSRDEQTGIGPFH